MQERVYVSRIRSETIMPMSMQLSFLFFELFWAFFLWKGQVLWNAFFFGISQLENNFLFDVFLDDDPDDPCKFRFIIFWGSSVIQKMAIEI